MTPKTRFAITYTVKNEENLLPDAIAYHLGLGCARIYVFFDGTTDRSRELVNGIDRVVCSESVSPRSLQNVPAWITEILPRWDESMDVRKRINTYTAIELARSDGIEWLINIDPDELLLMHDGTHDGPGDHEQFFDCIPSVVDQVLVPNSEAVPVGAGTGRPFVDCTLFLRRFPITEFLWRASCVLLRKIVANPKLHAWYDHWYYRLRFGGALPRLMHHPITGESIPAGYFLGYSNHKSFIRVESAKEFKFNIHRWEKIGRSPKIIKKGALLHYDLPSAEYFRAKFAQRPQAMLIKAFFCRHMFALIARELPDAVSRQFFLSNICITDTAKLNRLRRQSVVMEIKFISQFMNRRNQACT